MLNFGDSTSVVIPCFNDGRFVVEAVESVLRMNSIETILVNDGSTDTETLKILGDLREDRRVLVIDQPNMGLAAARNTGFQIATRPYVLPLDADNKIEPDYIHKAEEILAADKKVGVVYSDRFLFGERVGIARARTFNLSWLLADNYIDACAVIRKQTWEDCGGFDSGMPVQGFEDWGLWVAAADRGWHLSYVRKPLFHYRVRGGSMRSTMDDKKIQTREYLANKYPRLYAMHYTYFAHWKAPAEELVRDPARTVYQLCRAIVRHLLAVGRRAS
jgi:glycosyltransferase involved in cell wall biosynthesis